MNISPLRHRAALLATILLPVSLQAGIGEGGRGWPARSLEEALLYMIVFGLVGVGVAIVGYKLFDRCTPGDLHKEIIENKNTAAALVGAAIILGVSIIVAAAIMG